MEKYFIIGMILVGMIYGIWGYRNEKTTRGPVAFEKAILIGYLILGVLLIFNILVNERYEF